MDVCSVMHKQLSMAINFRKGTRVASMASTILSRKHCLEPLPVPYAVSHAIGWPSDQLCADQADELCADQADQLCADRAESTTAVSLAAPAMRLKTRSMPFSHKVG